MVEDEERMELLGRMWRTCSGGWDLGGHGCCDCQPPVARLDQVCLATGDGCQRSVWAFWALQHECIGDVALPLLTTSTTRDLPPANLEGCSLLAAELSVFIIGGLVHDLHICSGCLCR